MLVRITRQILLGDLDDIDQAVSEGATVILNVAKEVDDNKELPVKIIKIGLIDDAIEQRNMCDIATKVLTQLVLSGEVVFVHCAMGVSRSPYIVARYFAMKNKISVSRAYHDLKSKYPLADEECPLRGSYE